MNPSDPYSPPTATQANPAHELANLDVSKLTAVEKKALETLLPKKTGLSSRAAWMVGILHLIIGIIYVASGNPLDSSALVMITIKVMGYFALGYWARSWSPRAALAILIFHVLVYFSIISSFNRASLFFAFFAFVFLFGFMEARTRAALIQKARSPGFLKPPEVGLAVEEPARIMKPRFRTPGQIHHDD